VPTCWTRSLPGVTPASKLVPLRAALLWYMLRVVQRTGARCLVACPLQATAAYQALLLPHQNRGSSTTAALVLPQLPESTVGRFEGKLKLNDRSLGKLTMLTAIAPTVASRWLAKLRSWRANPESQRLRFEMD
jgi:hypothetical protein